MTNKTLILVSELWQLDKLDATSGGIVVALDAEIEEALAARDLEFISAKDYRMLNLDSRDAANEWAMQLLENKERPFAEYRGVLLGRVYFYSVDLYFTRVAYWSDIMISLLERYPDTASLVVYPSAAQATETTGDLAQEGIDALVDSVKLLGAQKGIDVVVPLVSPSMRDSVVMFALKRRLFGFLLGVWNMFLSLRQARPLRILVSDYWRNVSPFMQNIPDAELVFIDRLQALQAGVGNMWKWQMRFYHLDAFVGRPRDIPRDEKDLPFKVLFRGYDFGSLLSHIQSVLKHSYIPKALRDIDHAYAMLEQLHPHVVVLRVSTSVQTHFAILASVSRSLGIPSIEFQHGLEYNGADSLTRRKNAQYIGVYGPIIAKELVSAGIAQERIEIIGSPRFDVYTRVREQRRMRSENDASTKLSVLCIYPDLSYGDDHDSYDADTFMYGIADALRNIAGAHLTIKIRGPKREAFSRRRIAEICKGISYSIERDLPLPILFESSDVVISCYSTATIEAMQSGVPLVFFAATLFQVRLAAHFAPYLHARALHVAQNPEELALSLRTLATGEARRALVERADHFLAEAYAFDGRSAERAAEFVQRLARRTL